MLFHLKIPMPVIKPEDRDGLASEYGTKAAFDIKHRTPLYVSKTSRGNDKLWQGFVVEDPEGRIFTRTISYQAVKDGGHSSPLVSTPKLIEAKNVGRSNETTPLDQAISEINAGAQIKVDKLYVDEATLNGGSVEAAIGEQRPLPMLAHDFKKRGKNVEYPLYVQPKLDGTRMVSDGRIGWSRMGKDYIPEVIAHLKVENVIQPLDGELMIPHEDASFQESIRAIKKYRPETSEKLVYYVYDMIAEGLSFEDRWRNLQTLAHSFPPSVRLAETLLVNSEEEMRAAYARFMLEGYEGLMIRSRQGQYKKKDRSPDLLKFKEMETDEFEIVGFTQGRGKDEGTIIFSCRTPAGNTFQVRPKGTDEYRRDMYANGAEIVGKQLTVQYQNLSDDGIPRFPVGIAIRDYE